MPRGIYKRKKKKLGRPKGSRNKNKVIVADFPSADQLVKIINRTEPTEPPSYLSRLEAATVKYEQAINEAIEALKGK